MDIGFKSDVDQDKQSLMELIRTAKEFNNDLKEINNTKVIILIRDDHGLRLVRIGVICLISHIVDRAVAIDRPDDEHMVSVVPVYQRQRLRNVYSDH